MFKRCIWSIVMLACAMTLSLSGTARAVDDGIVRIKSAYSMPETIKRLKMDVADKGIMFFDEIDQSKLAADADVASIHASRVWQSTPRDVVPDFGSRCGARLAGATSRLSGCHGRRLGCLHRLRLDCAPTWNHGSRRSLQKGIGGDRIHYIDR